MTVTSAGQPEPRWRDPALAVALAALAFGAASLALAVYCLAGGLEPSHPYLIASLSGGLVALAAAAGVLRSRLLTRRRAHEREAFFATSLARMQGAEGFPRALGAALSDARDFFRASGVALPVQQPASGQAHLWAVPPGAPRGAPAQSVPLDADAASDWLFEASGEAWEAELCGGRWRILAVEQDGRVVSDGVRVPAGAVGKLGRRLGARRLTAVGFGRGREWEGRVVFVDAADEGPRADSLRFARRLVGELAGLIQQRFLLGRLRARIGAMERARIARELHDGTIQCLVGLEMEVNVLRRRADEEDLPLAGDLARVQGLLRGEILELRDTMQRLKPIEIEADQVVGFLDATVARFERDTGIRAIFDCAVEDVDLPARVCRELGRIVQEALQNVRRHSGARSVLVRFGRAPSGWRLVVDDDGRGFAAIRGTLTGAELGEGRKGPYVIRERVRSLGGELTVSSSPTGARLEILLPSENGRAE